MTPTDLAARYLAQKHPEGLHFTDGAFYPAAGGKLWPGDVHNDLWDLIDSMNHAWTVREVEGQHRLIRAAVRLLGKQHATPLRPMSDGALAAWLDSFHRFVGVKNRREVSRDLPFLNGGNWAEAYPVHHTERPRGMSFVPRHAAGEAVLRVRNYEPFAAGWSFCYRVIQPGAVTRAFWRGLPPDAPEPMPLGLDRPLDGTGGSWNQRLARWVPHRPEIPAR